MLVLIRNAKDSILQKTQNIIRLMKEKRQQRVNEFEESKNNNKNSDRTDSGTDSDNITEYAAHCFLQNEQEDENIETEYDIQQPNENNDIKSLTNVDTSDITKIS